MTDEEDVDKSWQEPLSGKRIRAFLANWLMEFGSGYTTREHRLDTSRWWCEEILDATSLSVRAYFTGDTHLGHKINQAGLDFLKGGEPDE